jgi:large subunit ribosomal protein L29
MDKNDIRSKNDAVLKEELKKLREQLYTLRTQTVTEKVADTSSFGKTKREIARVLTEQRARSLKAAPKAPAKAAPKAAAAKVARKTAKTKAGA